jgi:hypothetical protein
VSFDFRLGQLILQNNLLVFIIIYIYNQLSKFWYRSASLHCRFIFWIFQYHSPHLVVLRLYHYTRSTPPSKELYTFEVENEHPRGSRYCKLVKIVMPNLSPLWKSLSASFWHVILGFADFMTIHLKCVHLFESDVPMNSPLLILDLFIAIVIGSIASDRNACSCSYGISRFVTPLAVNSAETT